MNNTCRTCLQQTTTSYDLNSVKEKLLTCVPEINLWATTCDTRICNDCYNAINTAYTFKLKCHKTERKINNYYKKHNGLYSVTLLNEFNPECVNENAVIRFETVIIKQEEIPLQLEEESSEICAWKSASSSTRKRNYSCSQCGYIATNHWILSNHLRTHQAEKSFKCPHCKYITISKSYLKQHLLKHSHKKSFECSKCEYKTDDKLAFIEHTHIHSKKKSLACLQCTFTTNQKSDLITHLRVHTGKRPFKCLQCTYRAKRKSQLTIHVRTHTGERPFACSRCEFRFKDKSALIKHVNKHTNGNPSTLRCSKKTKWELEQMTNCFKLKNEFEEIRI